MVFQKELKVKKLLIITLIDFSEALIFSALNLMYHLPDCTFILPHEFNVNKNNSNNKNKTITFVTPEQIKFISKKSFDIAINTNSFHEMSKVVIKNYFKMMRHVLRKKNLFFTVNRVEKAMDLNSGQSINTKYASKEIYLNKKKHISINRFEEYDWKNSDIIKAYHTSEFNKIKTRNNFQLKIVKLKNALKELRPLIYMWT